MFNTLFAEETDQVADTKNEASTSGPSGVEASTPAGNPLFSLWNVATAVTSTVKARADELVKSVVDTDWRNELSAFSREVGEESKTLKEKTAVLVEHLPEQVGHLPEKAEEALHHLPSLPKEVHLPKEVGQTLEEVGVAFAQFGKSLFAGTKELLEELKDGVETEIAAASREGKRAGRNKTAAATAKLNSVQAKYSRFDAEVAAMQRDSSTYCDEPEDAEDYARWRAGFSLEGVKPDIARITGENAFMAELQSRLVPIIVEYDDFWSRYFYRLHKLQLKEEQRQNLAQRAKSVMEEDEVPLGWGDEDEQPPPPLPPHEAQRSPTTPHAADADAGADAASPTAHVAVAAPSEVTPSAEQGSAADGAAAAASPAEPAGSAASPVESDAPAQAPAQAPAEAGPGAGSARSSGTQSMSLSGGGASGSGSAGTEPVELCAATSESEPHVETASDTSARDWCMVGDGAEAAKRETSQGGAAAAVGQAAPGQAQPEASASPEEAQPAEVPGVGEVEPAESAVEPATEPSTSAGEADEDEKPAVSPAKPAASPSKPAASPSKPVASPSKPVASPSKPAAESKQAAAAAAAKAGAAAKQGDEEELDEDWGNWD